ncbi:MULTISPECIES: hypothetical protein [Halostella]|uniref:hypothetical protein n=1 Tax=Halostella TaxID=1843185 RepID=UPI00192A5CE2|nr:MULTISPECIES: hypothetical protein [Halostella]
MDDEASAADGTADDGAADTDGILAELRANPTIAAVELGSLAVTVCLPIATFWALLSGPRASTDILAAVVVVGAAFAALWTLVYPVYDAL